MAINFTLAMTLTLYFQGEITNFQNLNKWSNYPERNKDAKAKPQQR